MIILDSDIFTLLTYEHPNVCWHYEAVPDDERMAVTVVTWMEVLRGRPDSLLKAADDRALLAASARLQKTEAALDDFLVLHVDEAAARHFKTLQGQKKLNKMKRPDMLVACIALAHDALLVTRNTKHFNKVAGLKSANWADD
jgi:predicted nucleic acid-binding protein